MLAELRCRHQIKLNRKHFYNEVCHNHYFFCVQHILLTFSLKTLHNTLKAHYLLIWNTFWINRGQNMIAQPQKVLLHFRCELWAERRRLPAGFLRCFSIARGFWGGAAVTLGLSDCHPRQAPLAYDSTATLQHLYYILWAKYYN